MGDWAPSPKIDSGYYVFREGGQKLESALYIYPELRSDEKHNRNVFIMSDEIVVAGKREKRAIVIGGFDRDMCLFNVEFEVKKDKKADRLHPELKKERKDRQMETMQVLVPRALQIGREESELLRKHYEARLKEFFVERRTFDQLTSKLSYYGKKGADLSERDDRLAFNQFRRMIGRGIQPASCSELSELLQRSAK